MLHNRREFLHTAGLAGSMLLLADDKPLLADEKKTEWPKNPFLEGSFAPVHEEIAADHLKVIGKLPPDLDGMFIRNGPNPQFPPLGHYHWFDGDGMLHGVRLRDGKASYRNRYIRTDAWKEEKAAGRSLYGGLMTPPLPKYRQGKLALKNPANTALVWHNGRLLALWEAGLPHAIPVPTLDDAAVHDFNGKLKHPFTAHPKVDPATGEMLFFGYQFLQKPYVHYGVVSPQGEIVHTTALDLPRPVMMHDFAVTRNYAVFMDLPETFSLLRALRGESPLKFEPELGARIGILPRRGKGSDVKWFTTEACFVFHTLNTYEVGDEVVLLACRSKVFPDTVNFGDAGAAKKDDKLVQAVLYRWRFDLKTGKVREGPLDDVPAEFPRVPDALLGSATRFGYLAREGGDMFAGLLKYDLEKGKSEEHRHGAGRLGGEGVFVPRPEAKTEDDGWLLTLIHDAASGKSELVVIDARDFRAAPVARVLIPARVPYGFHGAWVEGTALRG